LFALGFALMVGFLPTQASAQVPPPPVLLDAGKPQCSDGIDNDGDGRIDFPSSGIPNGPSGDDGCMDPSRSDEAAGLPAGATRKSCPTTLQANSSAPGCDRPHGATVAGENVTICNWRIRGKLSDPRQSTLVEDTTFIGPGKND